MSGALSRFTDVAARRQRAEPEQVDALIDQRIGSRDVEVVVLAQWPDACEVLSDEETRARYCRRQLTSNASPPKSRTARLFPSPAPGRTGRHDV
ncbi:hypothetical protein ABZ434_24255 [Streptomyces sp. NPDC005761]|uniref:hypothetical protein n=1 Tax=Streptomyces sp. NPDC005761 TaxID=3157066 RepID=UPI0033E594A1